MKRRRHTPEQIIRKLREAERMLAEGAELPEVAKALEVSEQTFHRWRLERMGREEGGELLDVWLSKAGRDLPDGRRGGRTLQDHQRREVLEKFEVEGLPLYLKLAFEEARRWRSDTPPRETELRIGIPDLIRGHLFPRLAADEHHGALLVARSSAT